MSTSWTDAKPKTAPEARPEAGPGVLTDTAELRRHIDRKARALEQERESWVTHWKDLARHFMSHRSRFLDRGDKTNEGDRRNTKLYDSVGALAARTLASGMQSGLTSPSRPWFQLALRDDEVSQQDEAKYWIHETQKRMTGVFRRSNFYEQMHTVYGELAVFGTGFMLVEADPETVVRFRTLTVGEYSLGTDAAGRANSFVRRIMMTASQILEAWPDTCPGTVKDRAARDDQAWLEVIHLVEPNPEYKAGRADAAGRPFSSFYMLNFGGREIVEQSGYYEFPALCPRWVTTGSNIYGNSPAMDALADCRMLQRMRYNGLEALELETKPPLNVTTGSNAPLDLGPGGLNFLPSAIPGKEAVEVMYQVRAPLQALDAYMEGIRTQIRETLFNNLFMMLAHIDKSMTATEVAERNAEKMLMLGPVLDRMRSEIFQPLMERVLGIMSRQGELALPPDYMQGKALEIEFVSILAQAQKQSGLSSIHQAIGIIGQLGQAYPEVMDKLDSDETVNEVVEMLGVPPRIIRSDQAVQERRDQREQQMQHMQQMRQAEQMAALAQTGTAAMKNAGVTPDVLREAVSGNRQH